MFENRQPTDFKNKFKGEMSNARTKDRIFYIVVCYFAHYIGFMLAIILWTYKTKIISMGGSGFMYFCPGRRHVEHYYLILCDTWS